MMQLNKKFFKTLFINPDDINFISDYFAIVQENFPKNNYGIILFRKIKHEQYVDLIRYISKIPYINWIVFAPLKYSSRIIIFSMNPVNFMRKYDLNEILNKLNEIIRFDFDDISVYPVNYKNG